MRVCGKRLTERVQSHLPSHLDTFLREHPISSTYPIALAGGAIRDIVGDDVPKDYDLWMGEKDYGELMLHGWLSQLSQGRPIIATQNSVSSGEYQFITRWRWNDTPAHLLKQFDFTASKWVYYYPSSAHERPVLGCDLFTYTDTLDRKLVYSPPFSRDEVHDGSLRRAFRLAERGWKIDPSSVIPLAARAMYGDGETWENAVDKWYMDNPKSTQTPTIFY